MSEHQSKTVPVAGLAHTIGKGDEALFLWEKKALAGPVRGTILFIHGSSTSSLPQFDLQVPGRPEASVMNWFANCGFDAWCFDCRGYGRSYKGAEISATCSEGAGDALRACDYIGLQTGADKLFVYGGSAGALRAAILAARYPSRVQALALDGLVWRGADSPTLQQRRAKLEEWRRSTRRPIDSAFIGTIMSRDGVDSGDDMLAHYFAEQVLEADNSMPTGTYIDMCQNLPLVDPTEISVPTLIIRGEFDGVGTLADVVSFFSKLRASTKQICVIGGMAHATLLQKNYMLVLHALYSFFAQPHSVVRTAVSNEAGSSRDAGLQTRAFPSSPQ